jgi:NADH-quinone oxidoreductase subunit L
LVYVFFGQSRTAQSAGDWHAFRGGNANQESLKPPHESSAIMTFPLVVLAVFSIALSVIGTPVWPWFNSFLNGSVTTFDAGRLSEKGVLPVMLSSIVIVFLGYLVGWRLYGMRATENADVTDALEQRQPKMFQILRNGFYVDQLYRETVVRLVFVCSRLCDWFDRWVWGGAVWSMSYLVVAMSRVNRMLDTFVVNGGFDRTCKGLILGGSVLSRLQNGLSQNYLRAIGVAFVVLALVLLWGHHG